MAEVIAVNRYKVTDAAGFDAALRALVEKVQSAGHPGVLSYEFFRPHVSEARAVVRYIDCDAWVGHHDLIMGWTEMAGFRAVADLEEVLLFGPVSEAMQVWLDRMNLGNAVLHMGPSAAGFRRD